MIKKIIIKQDYEFLLSKESQKVFKVTNNITGKYTREKEDWKTFALFEEGLEIIFNKGLNVIVGDNGCGKSTLRSMIKEFTGKSPTNTKESLGFDKRSKEEKIKLIIKSRKDNEEFEVVFNSDFWKDNLIIFDSETDNPRFTAKDNINYNQNKGFGESLFRAWEVQEESHGESIIPVLEFLLTENIKDCIIIFDEIESGLSIRNQFRIFELLKKQSENNQIILFTHNPIWIQKSEQVYDLLNKEFINGDKYIKSYETKK